jgi:hypothetical protein
VDFGLDCRGDVFLPIISFRRAPFASYQRSLPAHSCDFEDKNRRGAEFNIYLFPQSQRARIMLAAEPPSSTEFFRLLQVTSGLRVNNYRRRR